MNFDVVEYVYDNPGKETLRKIAKGLFAAADGGEYIDLAGAKEMNDTQRYRDKVYVQAVKDGDMENAQKMVDSEYDKYAKTHSIDQKKAASLFTDVAKRYAESSDGDEEFGIRYDDRMLVPEEIFPNSHELFQDNLYDEEGNPVYPEGEGPYSGYYDAGELAGTSTIGISDYGEINEESLKKALSSPYWGKYVYLVAGQLEGDGSDVGEHLLSNAKVLCVLSLPKGQELTHEKFVNKSREAVTRNDDGEIIPLSQRFNEGNPDIRYQKADEDSGERKTLMGVHNITAEKLRKALKLGGLANPSMAVVNTENGIHDKYGEISLIPSPSLIDRSTGRNAGTWRGDAYTPRFPRVEQVMGSKGRAKAGAWLRGLPMPGEMRDLALEAFNPYVSDGGTIDKSRFAYVYLAEKGKSKELDRYSHDDVDSAMVPIVERYADKTSFSEEYGKDAGLRQQMAGIYKGIHMKEWRKAVKERDTELARQLKSGDAGERWKALMALNGKAKALAEKAMRARTDNDGGLNARLAQEMYDEARDAYQHNGKLDAGETQRAAQRYIDDNNMGSDFDRWYDSKLKELGVKEKLYLGIDSQGRRRYQDATLENVSRAMRSQGRAGAEGSMTGFGGFAARRMGKLGSLDKIKAAKGQLREGADETERLKDKYNRLVNELVEAGADMLHAEDIADELADQADPVGYAKREYGYDLPADYAKEQAELIEGIKKMPTMYFETKFERPVYLNEFKKAVVPADTPADIKDALKAAGLEIVTYDRGKEGDRERATMEAADDDVLFRDGEEEDEDVLQETVRNAKMRHVESSNDDKLSVTDLPASTEIPVTKIEEESKTSVQDALKAVEELPNNIETLDGYKLRVSSTTRKKLKNEINVHKDDQDVLTAMKHLKEVVGKSVLIEEHRDRIKVDGVRKPENPSDQNIDKVQRFYGAMDLNGTPYRVKSTAIVTKNPAGTRLHNYEITNIELLSPIASTRQEAHTAVDSNSISLANLLKNVEFSYESGKKVLDEINKNLSPDTAEPNGESTKFRYVQGGPLLDFLNGQPTRKGYRYAQWANFGVLPPMTAKVDGEWRPPMIFGQWEQSEEGMRKPNGKADLVQGNGRTTGNVAYNPYFHIRTSPLNDQFTAAYDRPELVVVEGEYPESELTSGYRAPGAKNSVGLMDWHSGSVNGQLSEGTKVQTMLSRYFKPKRIVPWGEVAE